MSACHIPLRASATHLLVCDSHHSKSLPCVVALHTQPAKSDNNMNVLGITKNDDNQITSRERRQYCKY